MLYCAKCQRPATDVVHAPGRPDGHAFQAYEGRPKPQGNWKHRLIPIAFFLFGFGASFFIG